MPEHPKDSSLRFREDEWDFIDEAARGLEDSWQGSGDADITQFVPKPDHSLRERTLIELIKVDQEYRWGAGQHKKLEEYLAEWVELNDKPDAIKELLIAECQTRAYLNQHATADELRQRFSDIAAKIDLAKIAHEAAQAGRTQHRALRVNCPHCHNPVEIVDDVLLGEIACPSCGSSFNLIGDETSDEDSRALSQKIGRFELLERLGEGTFGTVWRAKDTELDCIRAVKIPRKSRLDKEEREKFLREARAAAQLRHPNIVSVHEVGVEDETIYIVSDFIEGLTLDKWLKQHKPAYNKLAELCAKIGESLHHAHGQGVIHRDLKPANVIISANGEPHVMDFGLAKREAGEITMTIDGQILGTPAYMPPEQATGSGHDADRRSDVYSLGVILFELLTSEQPFRGNVRMLLKQVVEDEPPSPRKLDSRIPRDLETICLKCLEKLPERRYSSTQEMADELWRHLRGEPIHARPVDQLEHLWRWCKRKPLASGLLTAFVLAIFSGIMVSSYFAIQKGMAYNAAIAALEREFVERIRANESMKRAKDEDLTFQDKAGRMAYARHITLTQQELEAGNEETARVCLDLCRWDFRGWEHDYLYAAMTMDMNARNLSGHLGGIYSVAFSPDGRRIVSGSADTTLKVWDAATGKEMYTLKGHRGIVNSVAFSPDGRRIVSGSNDKTINKWNANTGKLELKFTGHTDSVSSVNFSPDGQLIISGSWDKTVKVWNATTGQEIRTLKGHTDKVNSAAFSPDGRRIVSGSSDNTLKVWNAATGKIVHTIEGHDGDILCVAFSPDGKRVASGSSDGLVKVWNATTGLETHTLEVYTDSSSVVSDYATGQILGTRRRLTKSVSSVAFSPDGQRIVSGSSDNTVRIWDSVTGQEYLMLKKIGAVTSVAFSPDGYHIVSGSNDRTVKVWGAKKHPKTLTFKAQPLAVGSVAFSPDGRKIASSGGGFTAKIWDARTGEEILSLRGDHIEGTHSVIFSPDGKRIICGVDSHVKVWDATTGEEELILKGHMFQVRSVAFSPDGRRIVSGSVGGAVKVWNAVTGEEIRTHWVYTAGVNCVAFSPNNRMIVGDVANNIKVWDDVTGQEILTLKGHTHRVTSVAFSPDGTQIVSGSSDKTVKLWDATTGQETHTLKGHTSDVYSVAFSPDGRRIVSGSADKTVKVWDVTTGKEILTLKGHTDVISSVAFSPDGKRIVSGSHDDTVKVWDASK